MPSDPLHRENKLVIIGHRKFMLIMTVRQCGSRIGTRSCIIGRRLTAKAIIQIFKDIKLLLPNYNIYIAAI